VARRAKALVSGAVSLAAVAVAVALAAPASAGAATYTVTGGDGGCGGADLACGTIAAAAAVAGNGDTVLIKPGTYSESATFGGTGVTVRGSTQAPGVVVTGTLTFSGDGGASNVLEQLILAAPSGGAPAVDLTGSAGTQIRDAAIVGADGSGISISAGANALTRATVLTAAAAGRAVDMQLAGSPASLVIDSSILGGGASGIGLAVKTGGGSLPLGGAGSATIVARHATIAGAATGISLDASAATGLLSPVGNISATVSDSIVEGANPTKTNPGGLLVLSPNSATLALARTDQTTSPDKLFVNPAKHNFHLRADAPVIGKGQITDGDSATDIDGQPRSSGGVSDLGADEFVNSPPKAAITLKTPSPRANQPITLDGSGSTDQEAGLGSPIKEYRWTFGDGTTATTTTPTVDHAYGGPGAVTASLVVVDGEGALSDPASVSFQLANGTPPRVVITTPKANANIAIYKKKGKHEKVAKRARIVFSGTAIAGPGVKNVVLTIQKVGRSGNKCIWLNKSKGLVKSSCAHPELINATIKSGRWTYTVKSTIKLIRGQFRISVYGVDKSGAFGNSAPTANRVLRFRFK
jgi:hypothetical protein